jgi:hypothetical protein
MLYREREYFESEDGSYIEVSPTIRNDENMAMKSWSRTARRIVLSLISPRNSFFAMIDRCFDFIRSTPE